MALTKINSSVIANNTIAVGNIADNSVDATKIASNSILTRHIDDNQIGIDQLNVSDGSNGQALTTNGSGTLAFSTISSTPTSIADADSDTKIQAEESSDEDVIRFDVGGTEYMTLTSNGKLNVTEIAHISSGSLELGNGDEKQIFDASGETIQFQTADTERLRISGNNLHLNGGTDARIQLGTGGAGANSTSNDTVHIRGDGDNMKLMTAADGQYIFENNGTEYMRINSSGFVGIGGFDPAFLGLSGSGTSRVLHVGGTNAQLRLTNSIIHHDNAGLTKLTIRNNYGATSNSAQMELQAGFITLETGTSFTERFRINSSGRQTYNSSGTANAHATFVGEVGVSYKALAFERTVGGGEVGTIVANASSTTYNTSSDYRLKENVDYTWDATARLKQLKPARFNWISDDTNTLVDGFLAHEVSSIVPEAIYGEKDGMANPILYENGDEIPEGKSVGDVKTPSVPEYQAIDHSKLVPLLVKTIQELEARIATLEG